MMNSDLPSSPAEAASFLERMLHKQVGIQAKKVGGIVATSATTVREIGAEIESRHPTVPAERVGANVATYLDGVASYLSRTDGATLLADAERNSAKQPAVAALTAAALGFLTARILKVANSGRSSA